MSKESEDKSEARPQTEGQQPGAASNSLARMVKPFSAVEAAREASRHTTDLQSILHSFETNSLAATLEKINRPFVDMERIQKSIEANTLHAARLTEVIDAHQSASRALSRFWEDQERTFRTALGPIDDMQRMIASATSILEKEHENWRRLTTFAAEQFRLPKLEEISSLVSQVSASLPRLDLHLAPITAAMASIKTPWLRIDHELASARAFTQLQNIGATLRNSAAFDDSFVESLRTSLGDWREVNSVPVDALNDLKARSRFYEDLGLDPKLTSFAPQAFHQALKVAGIEDARDVLIVEDYAVPSESQEEEDGYERTNKAHDKLQRFETQLRRFVDKRMTEVVGPKWIKQRVPEETRNRWTEKRERALAAGEPERPLIAYADFTDYERVLLRKDNWEEVFRITFVRQESVRESLLRLYPVRVCTMHARPITQDDELLLAVEIKRLLKAMGVI